MTSMPLLLFCYIRKKAGEAQKVLKSSSSGCRKLFPDPADSRGITPKHHFSQRPIIRLAASLRCSTSWLLLRTRTVLEANTLSL